MHYSLASQNQIGKVRSRGSVHPARYMTLPKSELNINQKSMYSAICSWSRIIHGLREK